MSNFYAFYLDEPDLIFGNRGEDKDPRIGLRRFGPYYSTDEEAPSPSQVRVGIIGSGETITLAKQFFRIISLKIDSESTNRWLYPDFPGFSIKTQIQSELINADRWNATITQQEMKKVIELVDTNHRIACASQLYFDKLTSISIEEDRPNVVVCTLPSDIEEYCGISKKTRGAKKPKFTQLEKYVSDLKGKNQKFLSDWGLDIALSSDKEPEKDYDLHNSMKGRTMALNIPIQVIRESSMRDFIEYPSSHKGQNQATFAWNISMGLYYKANGRPWRLAKLTPGTCYVGISFYKNLRNPRQNIESSMAQLFTHSGEGFVLRGTDIIVDEQTREAHLSRTQSESLLRDVIDKYAQRAGSKPSRVVVHKSSIFTEDEKKGFLSAIDNSKYDFIAIKNFSADRFLRIGEYPVLRGTVIQLTAREYLLFTGGYISRLRTYPGHKVPEPLHLIHDGDSDASLVCSEILGLTKLNWNTTSFSTYRPITIDFASKVGAILSELPEGRVVQDHYRFYM